LITEEEYDQKRKHVLDLLSKQMEADGDKSNDSNKQMKASVQSDADAYLKTGNTVSFAFDSSLDELPHDKNIIHTIISEYMQFYRLISSKKLVILDDLLISLRDLPLLLNALRKTYLIMLHHR
jgi:hypothetical protein